MLGAILSALHVLALRMGLGGVFARGRALRRIVAGDASAVKAALLADSFWGVAALLWIATGLLRAFGGIEKSPGFYLYNVFFWIKMALFGLVFSLEAVPLGTMIGWRFALKRGASPDTRGAARLVLLNDAETVLVLLIPFVAAAMARGLWLIG
jgi:putative membrane protein